MRELRLGLTRLMPGRLLSTLGRRLSIAIAPMECIQVRWWLSRIGMTRLTLLVGVSIRRDLTLFRVLNYPFQSFLAATIGFHRVLWPRPLPALSRLGHAFLRDMSHGRYLK